MCILTSNEVEQAKRFAYELADKKFNMWQSRDRNLTIDKTIENLYRGKCGEIAAYNFLTEAKHVVSAVDFTVYDKVKHDADLEIVGSGIKLHVKTCLKNFASWTFQREAQYVANPTNYDFNVFVQQNQFDDYSVRFIRQSRYCKYEPLLNGAPSKCCVNENTLTLPILSAL